MSSRETLPLAPALLFALLVCLCATPIAAQNTITKDASAPAAKLRAMYFARDYEGGYVEGNKLAREYPNSVDIQVWSILNAARGDKADEALELADKLKAANPEDGWSWFAYAGALNFHNERGKEALPASERMFALLGGNDDAIWLRAAVIRAQDKLEDAIAFIDEYLAKVKNPAELLVLKASALYSQYLSKQQNRDEAKLKASMNAFAEALKADPNNVDALYLQASYLTSEKKNLEASALLRRALALAPESNLIHREYWRAVNGRADLSGDAKQKEIEADIALLMKNRGDYVSALLLVSNQYDALGLIDKKKEIDDRILKLAPVSREAEWVLIGRMRKLAREIFEEKGGKDAAKPAAYRQMLQDYVDLPRHFNHGLLGEVYRNLFLELSKDSSVSNAELLSVAKRMIEYEKINVHITYPAAATALAERKINFREAEAWAREGIVEAKKKADSQRRFYKSDAEYETSLNWMTGMMYDALGWVFFNEGRAEDAERELLQAHKLNEEDVKNLFHLGQLYQQRKDYAKAEEYYIKGSLVTTLGENKNDKALKALYEIRHGSLDGYEKYLAKIGEMDTAKRKLKVLAERNDPPRPMNEFNLKTPDGKPFSSAGLKGKVAVVNIWGIWCGPCVQEMPEFQKLHEKYKDDADVVILSINNDSNPADVPKWMRKNKYNFNVLIDDGYLGKADVHSFPTTWFLNRDGRITFVKVGWTERLTEEFSWRIDALKGKDAAAAK